MSKSPWDEITDEDWEQIESLLPENFSVVRWGESLSADEFLARCRAKDDQEEAKA